MGPTLQRYRRYYIIPHIVQKNAIDLKIRKDRYRFDEYSQLIGAYNLIFPPAVLLFRSLRVCKTAFDTSH